MSDFFFNKTNVWKILENDKNILRRRLKQILTKHTFEDTTDTQKFITQLKNCDNI
jgi:hypothetical protein